MAHSDIWGEILNYQSKLKYVGSSQKKLLNEMVLLSTQKKGSDLWIRIYNIFRLTKVTVKPAKNCHSKIVKTKISMTNCSLMKVKSFRILIAPFGAFCKTLDLHLVKNGLGNQLLVFLRVAVLYRFYCSLPEPIPIT